MVVGAVLLAQCNTVRVLEAGGTEEFDLSSYETYNFYRTTVGDDSLAQGFRAQVDLLKMAVSRQMELRGLARDTTNPELLVNLGIAVESKVQTRETNIWDAPVYIGQRRYAWRSTEIPVSRYQKGMFAVDLVDADQEQMVWQGKVEGIVPDRIGELQEAMVEGVAKLFEQMPGTEESSASTE